MIDDITPTLQSVASEEKIKNELTANFDSKRKRIFTKLLGAALGSIPWVGGFLSASVDFKNDEKQARSNQLFEQWLQQHSEKMKLLGETLVQIMNRLNDFPESIDERLESEEFSGLVKKSFRSWDNADTVEKRDLIRKVLTNAGAYQLVPDDLIRLFLDWINLYHEVHFSVIRIIYNNDGATRRDIWLHLNTTIPVENSPEADLFRFVIRDLSTGGIIRQHRRTDSYGNFYKKNAPSKSSVPSKTMTSAFDDREPYELTELGKQFVHYAMNEIVPRVGNQ